MKSFDSPGQRKKLHHRRPPTVAEIAREIWTCFFSSDILRNQNYISGLKTMSQQAFTKGFHKSNLIHRARLLCLCPLRAATNTKQDDQRRAQIPDHRRDSLDNTRLKRRAQAPTQHARWNKMEDKLGDKPKEATQHPRPAGKQDGRQDRRQEKNKPSEADMAIQTRRTH